MRKLHMLLIFLVTTAHAGEHLKSFKPSAIWPDNEGVHINAHGGGIVFHNGVYYWFGEHKIKGKKELKISGTHEPTPLDQTADGGVHCYSSTDLLNWKDEGVALSVDYDNIESDIAYGCILERPKVLHNEKNDNFVMFFKLFLRGTVYGPPCFTGVAVAENVTGPYKYSHKFLGGDPKAGSGDFALFKDDDSAYHICSSRANRSKCIVKLADDYLKPSGPYSILKGIPRGVEAPAIFKRKGKYYLIGSGLSGWRPNAARSFWSDSLTGTWKSLGNPCVGKNPINKHGPAKTFGGQSTYVLPVRGIQDAYIAMFDMWRPKNPIDGRYIWLPIKFTDKGFKIEWLNEWNLSVFENKLETSESIGDR